MINVTKSFLPPKESYQKYLEQIWESVVLTNYGCLNQELEKQLVEYLGCSNLFYVSNGTVALQIAIKALGLKGEVITTPFSYVATCNSILWENCTPVFVDIDPNALCIDANKIEEKINDRTSAILGVHVYGMPCDVQKIGELADKYQLKVIYDGAHAFGVKVDGQPISNYGDIMTYSFHATKLFHTIEGGGITCNDPGLLTQLHLLRINGHTPEKGHLYAGTNAKASEFHAAMGLSILPYLDEIIDKRKRVYELYFENLSGSSLKFVDFSAEGHNYAYAPVIFESEEKLLKSFESLAQQEIFPRRYFYPSLNTIKYAPDGDCPISEDISRRIACLPMYPDLSTQDLMRICKTLKDSLI